MRLVVWGYLAVNWRIYPRDISRAFLLPHAVGARDGDRPRGGSDAECDRTNCRNPGQAERAGEGQRRVVSDRSGAVSIQGRAVAGLARRGEAAGRDSEIELRAGDGECYGAHRTGRLQQKAS